MVSGICSTRPVSSSSRLPWPASSRPILIAPREFEDSASSLICEPDLQIMEVATLEFGAMALDHSSAYGCMTDLKLGCRPVVEFLTCLEHFVHQSCLTFPFRY